MHPRFLSLLCCPATHESLSLEASEMGANGTVMTGVLISTSGRRYPIVRGIPRFVGAEYYTSSFGYEWNRWPRVQFEVENVGRTMAGHTTRMWEAATLIGQGKIEGQTIVEFGCGSGRFLDVVRRKGGIAVGIDLSQAVEAAHRNLVGDLNVLIVQGDLFSPPFREGVFDGGYTIGVLHHTPDPAKGLEALVQTLRVGGWAACTVYPRGEFYDYPSVTRLRELHQHLKPLFGYRPALAYAYLSAYVLTPVLGKGKRIPGMARLLDGLEKNWLVILALPDARWRALDIFDAITPSIATTHSGEEVMAWFEQAGCAGMLTTPWCNTSVVGIKSGGVKASTHD